VVFGVLTVTMNITAIRDMALCSMVDKKRRMGGNYCVNFLGVLTLNLGAEGFAGCQSLVTLRCYKCSSCLSKTLQVHLQGIVMT
jgi:hypothetical protein